MLEQWGWNVAIAVVLTSFGYTYYRVRQLQTRLNRDRQIMDRCFERIHARPLQALAFLIREIDRSSMSPQQLREYLRQVYKEAIEEISVLEDDSNNFD